MAIVDRISTLVRANINDLIDRAEDPEKVIKQLLADMHSQLAQVKTEVAAAIADEKQLSQRWQENQTQAAAWQRKAELAVEKGQDDLAREALQRRSAFQQTAESFKEQYAEQARQVAVLKDALGELDDKINEAETKKDLLIARHRRAEAETRIRGTLAGVDTSGALASFERMEDKVNQEEARAAALGELEHDTVDDRFKLLETDSDVDRELAALKAKKELAAGGEAKALEAGEAAAP